MPVHHDEVDGVPVFWVDDPGPFTAGLVLGMGTLDETFRTAGVSHAVEHLALTTLGRTHLDFTGTTGLAETEFSATGPVDQVLAFLATVCSTLADLPMDRLEHEADVIAAESSSITSPADGMLLALRYGFEGAGVSPLDVVPASALCADGVLAHARTHAVRGNAAVFCSRRPPSAMRLPLPDGPRPVRRTPVVRGPARGWAACDTPQPGLGFTGADTPALRAAGRVLADRCMEQLRREEAILYDLGHQVLLLPGGGRHVSLAAECRAELSGRVAERVWQLAADLAADGPDAEDLAHDAAGVEALLADPRSLVGEAAQAATDHVSGRRVRSRAALRAEIAALTPDAVRDALAGALERAYLVVPHGSRPDVDLPELSFCATTSRMPRDAQPLRRKLFRSAAPPGTALFTVPDGVGFLDEDGDVHVVRWDDCVGVGVDGDTRVVVGRDRCWVLVDPADWRDGERAVRHVDAGADRRLRYPVRHDDALEALAVELTG